MMVGRLSAGSVIVIGGTSSDGIGHRTIDFGFVSARAVSANPDLGWESAFGDLAIDSGPGQAGAIEGGLETDDPIRGGYGGVASCCLFPAALDPVRTSLYAPASGFSHRRTVP